MLIKTNYENFNKSKHINDSGFNVCNEYKIYYLISGNATFQMENGASFCISSGEAVLILPYEKHKLFGTISRQCEILFDKEAIPEQIYDDIIKCFIDTKRINFSKRQDIVNIIVDRLNNEVENEKSYKEVSCKALLHRFFIEIVRFAEDGSIIQDDGQAMMKVVEFIDNNYNRKISMEEMMKVACMGPSCFQQKFKKYMGMTPVEYLNKTRISMSIKFLCNHSLTTEDIAHLVGMKSASYYCSQFKKYMKTSPKSYGKLIDSTLNHFNSQKIIDG